MGGHGAGVAAQLKYRRSQLAKPKGRRRPSGPIHREKWVDPKQATFEELMEIRFRMRRQRKIRVWKNVAIAMISIAVAIWVIGYFIPHMTG